MNKVFQLTKINNQTPWYQLHFIVLAVSNYHFKQRIKTGNTINTHAYNSKSIATMLVSFEKPQLFYLN